MDITGFRRSYEQGELDERDTTEVPVQLFDRWFADARRVKGLEPNAMTLATADAEGRPSARIVLLKGYDDAGLVWYTNYTSRKGHELDANPRAALLFYWAPLERQVRVEGPVELVTPEESDAYYAVRPLDSRIGAWASPQSEVIANRGVLVANAAKAAAEAWTMAIADGFRRAAGKGDGGPAAVGVARGAARARRRGRAPVRQSAGGGRGARA